MFTVGICLRLVIIFEIVFFRQLPASLNFQIFSMDVFFSFENQLSSWNTRIYIPKKSLMVIENTDMRFLINKKIKMLF